MPTPPGIYRHYKGGLYVVVGTITDSTNGRDNQPMTLYYSLKHQKMIVREEGEFNGFEGEQKRFTLLEEEGASGCT